MRTWRPHTRLSPWEASAADSGRPEGRAAVGHCPTSSGAVKSQHDTGHVPPGLRELTTAQLRTARRLSASPSGASPSVWRLAHCPCPVRWLAQCARLAGCSAGLSPLPRLSSHCLLTCSGDVVVIGGGCTPAGSRHGTEAGPGGRWEPYLPRRPADQRAAQRSAALYSRWRIQRERAGGWLCWSAIHAWEPSAPRPRA